MLYPTMESLVKMVGNRYLLVNITAHRAREIAEEAMENGQKLEKKPVTLAVEQIYEEGLRRQAEQAKAEKQEAEAADAAKGQSPKGSKK